MPVAVNCSCVPAANEGFAGVTAIETREAGNPVPFSETVCGLLLALSTNVSVPDLVPVAPGENVTDTLQLVPAASVAGLKGHVELKAKSARLPLTLRIVNLDDWLFASVTTWLELVVPSACPANTRLEAPPRLPEFQYRSS